MISMCCREWQGREWKSSAIVRANDEPSRSCMHNRARSHHTLDAHRICRTSSRGLYGFVHNCSAFLSNLYHLPPLSVIGWCFQLAISWNGSQLRSTMKTTIASPIIIQIRIKRITLSYLKINFHRDRALSIATAWHAYLMWLYKKLCLSKEYSPSFNRCCMNFIASERFQE